MSELSGIYCSFCRRPLAYGETVAVIGSGVISGTDPDYVDPDYVDEGEIQEVLCESCDAAMTLFLQRLWKFHNEQGGESHELCR